jgi:hypothetical protein
LPTLRSPKALIRRDCGATASSLSLASAHEPD